MGSGADLGIRGGVRGRAAPGGAGAGGGGMEGDSRPSTVALFTVIPGGGSVVLDFLSLISSDEMPGGGSPRIYFLCFGFMMTHAKLTCAWSPVSIRLLL